MFFRLETVGTAVKIGASISFRPHIFAIRPKNVRMFFYLVE